MTAFGAHPADVTVVTVTYNAADLVSRCLEGLARQQLGDLTMEVVVVDNASTDGTPDIVAAHHPAIRLVRATRNLGFAGGNNLVLAKVESPVAILLNNDAVPEPTFVRELVHCLHRAPDDVAAVAATVLLAPTFRPAMPGEVAVVEGPDGRWIEDPRASTRLVNSTGNEMRTDGFGVDRGWLADSARHAPPRDVFGFSGAACALRTTALRDVGLFDERLFMYYEDTDLSWRLRLAGYRIEHCPDAVVSHVHAASSTEGSDFFRFHDTRNRLAILTKNATAGLALRSLVAFLLTTASVALRGTQPWSHTKTRLRALRSYTRMLPGLLDARRQIGRAARVTRAETETLLVEPGAPTGPYRT